jgi:hypothetical protein
MKQFSGAMIFLAISLVVIIYKIIMDTIELRREKELARTTSSGNASLYAAGDWVARAIWILIGIPFLIAFLSLYSNAPNA